MYTFKVIGVTDIEKKDCILCENCAALLFILMKILEDFEEDAFRPEEPLTRAELAVIMINILGAPDEVAPGPFADVPDNYWAWESINAAFEQGMFNGYDGKFFGPDDTVTYEQAISG